MNAALSERRAAVLPIAAVIVDGARRFAYHPDGDPVAVFDVSHCTICGCRSAAEITACTSPACPARERKAA